MNVLNKLLFEKLVSVIETDRVNTAKVSYREGRFIIELNPGIKEKDLVILHELMHIIRGDLLLDKDIDHTIANIAQDAIINQILDFSHCTVNGENIELVTYDNLKKWYPDIPYWKLGWKVLYDYLKNQDQDIEFQSDVAYFTSNNPQEIEDIKQKIRSIRKEILKDKDHPLHEFVKNSLKDSIQSSSTNSSGTQQSSLQFEVTHRQPNSLLMKILKNLPPSSGNVKSVQRTYRREGIAHKNLPRYLPIPVNDVTFIVDVSGSYIDVSKDKVLPAILALISKGYKVRLFVFDDTCKEVHINKNYIKFTGSGGTLFLPVVNTLRAKRVKSNVIVMISDYEIFDIQGNTQQVKNTIMNMLKKYANKVLLYDWKELE